MTAWLQTFKMPDPLLVIGFMYAIVALFYLISIIKEGNLKGVIPHIVSNLRTKYFLSVVLFIPFSVCLIDQKISQFFFDHRTPIVANIFNFINSLGEGWFVAGVVLTVLVISQLKQCEKLVAYCKMSITSLIYVGILNSILKVLFNRQRPSINLQDQFAFFSFFQSKEHNLGDLIYASNSFPSGHAITVFAALTPFLFYSKNKLAKTLLLSYGLIVCFARVYTQNHWLSDVVIGASLGAIVGIAAYRAYLEKSN